jgi:hypothetical protein
VVRQCIGTWFEPELARIKKEELQKKKIKPPLSSTSRRARPRGTTWPSRRSSTR